MPGSRKSSRKRTPLEVIEKSFSDQGLTNEQVTALAAKVLAESLEASSLADKIGVYLRGMDDAERVAADNSMRRKEARVSRR